MRRYYIEPLRGEPYEVSARRFYLTVVGILGLGLGFIVLLFLVVLPWIWPV